MEELIKALEIVDKWEKLSYIEMLTAFNNYTGQDIPDSVAKEMEWRGLTPVDMITSDFLTQKGYMNLYEYEQYKTHTTI